MNILHVTKKYPDALGGDAVVVANLEKQQQKAGDHVAILTSNCDDIQAKDHLYKFGLKDTAAALDNITPKRLISLVLLFFKAYSVFKRERPDVIHTHSVDMAFFVSFAARHYKIPIVHTFHIVTFNDPRHAGLRSKVELKLLKGAKPKQIFLLNPNDRDDFAAAGFPQTKFVPNGVNLDDWRTNGVKKTKPLTFIAVGRLEEQKGFTYLIEAAAQLAQTQSDFQVQIVGEGSERQKLEDLIASHGLGERVVLLGRRNPAELRQLYAEAEIFVLSSLWEGMPLSLLEAWAAGLPTVATTVSSVPHIATGVSELVEPTNATALATAMGTLLTDTVKREQLRAASSKRVAEDYQWSIISKGLYDEVIR